MRPCARTPGARARKRCYHGEQSMERLPIESAGDSKQSWVYCDGAPNLGQPKEHIRQPYSWLVVFVCSFSVCVRVSWGRAHVWFSQKAFLFFPPPLSSDVYLLIFFSDATVKSRPIDGTLTPLRQEHKGQRFVNRFACSKTQSGREGREMTETKRDTCYHSLYKRHPSY